MVRVTVLTLPPGKVVKDTDAVSVAEASPAMLGSLESLGELGDGVLEFSTMEMLSRPT